MPCKLKAHSIYTFRVGSKLQLPSTFGKSFQVSTTEYFYSNEKYLKLLYKGCEKCIKYIKYFRTNEEKQNPTKNIFYFPQKQNKIKFEKTYLFLTCLDQYRNIVLLRTLITIKIIEILLMDFKDPTTFIKSTSNILKSI